MKKRMILVTLIVLAIGLLAACGGTAEPIEPERPDPTRPAVTAPTPTPEPTPEPPVDEPEEWPNWLYDADPQWWTMPGWGISTTVDGTWQAMGLYFNARDELLPVAQEMGISSYLGSLGLGGFEHHALPLIAAAAAGDLEVQGRIVEALANRLLAMRVADSEMYDFYMAIFSDRGLVYDEVTRDIFNQLHDLLAAGQATTVGLFRADLSVISIFDMLYVFRARLNAEPVDEMLPTLVPVENMFFFRGNPTAFLYAFYEVHGGHTWEFEWLAFYITFARFDDPVLYASYADFLDHVAELELSDGADQLRTFLFQRIEEIYAEQREWR